MKQRAIDTINKRNEAIDARSRRFPIEKGVPLPLPKSRKTLKIGAKIRSTLFFPLDQMKIGDSFFVPKGACNGHPSCKIQDYISRHPHLMFSTRKVTRGTEEGWRVWRVPRRWKIGEA